MANNLEVFTHKDFGEIRIVQEGENYLFCGSDVAHALGYTNPPASIKRHCKGITKRYTLTTGGPQLLSYITEGDVYRLICHSKLPSAEAFERWVFDEVLPTIRKHGAYMTDNLIDQVIARPDTIYELAKVLLDEREKNLVLTEQLTAAKPKADYFDAFIDPLDSTNIRTTAKELDIPEKTFTSWLLLHKYAYRAPAGHLMPYSKPFKQGLFTVKEYYRRNSSTVGVYMLVTARGKAYFRERRDKILTGT